MNPLEQLRYQKGLTIIEVAEGAGISRSTVIRLEQGARPSAKVAGALARFYGVPVADLMPEREAA